MGSLKIVAAIAVILLSASAHAQKSPATKSESIFCPVQAIDKLPVNEWRIQYHGMLKAVWLTRNYPPHETQSVVSCYRDVGVVSKIIPKPCHLVQGEGKTVLATEDPLEEIFICIFKQNSFEDNNDHACKVLCD